MGLVATCKVAEGFPQPPTSFESPPDPLTLLASAMLQSKADTKAVFADLEHCLALDPANEFCSGVFKRMKADLERLRCDGSALKKPLTARGAYDEWDKTPGDLITANGAKYTVEPTPFLSSKDFSVVSVDASGDLALEVTAAARARLEQETKRLIGKNVALMFGDEVLLVARVSGPTTEGRVQITHGNAKPFTLDALCRTIDRPVVK